MKTAYLLAMALPVVAEASSAEITAGEEYASLDTRLSHSLGDKVGLFVWNIAAVNYDAQGSNFMLVDVSYQITDRMSLVVENQFIGDYGFARCGAQYYSENGNFNSFFLATVGSPFDTVDLSGEFAAIIGYNKKYSDHVGLSARIEEITNVGSNGHNFSIQRMRIGPSYDTVRFGVSADLMEVGGNAIFSHNLGVYTGIDF